MLREKVRRIHFVGIGGIGMSGLAILFKDMGYLVSGSDVKESENVKNLKKLGIKVFIGHRPENVEGAQVVIYSSAVPKDNVELVAARSKGLPVIPRADILSELMRFKEGVAVAGTHGKTTTTSMIATIFHRAGLQPSILVGGRLEWLDGLNAVSGKSEILVAEADESDGTFLKLTPALSVITNIDSDHLDFYGNLENVKSAFCEFANRTSFYGSVILCIDCQNVREIKDKIYKKTVTYGFSSQEFRISNFQQSGFKSSFSLSYREKPLGTVQLNVPGVHNALNATAAIIAALEFGIPFENAKEFLSDFKNAKRRLEEKGQANGVLVIDDYGHHPNEIKNTLNSLKEAFPDKRLVVLFQPHRFSRTKHLWNDFVNLLSNVDNLFIMDIYPAGEEPIDGIDSESLAKLCGATYAGDAERAEEILLDFLKSGDLLLTLGAGNVYKVGESIVKRLRSR